MPVLVGLWRNMISFFYIRFMGGVDGVFPGGMAPACFGGFIFLFSIPAAVDEDIRLL